MGRGLISADMNDGCGPIEQRRRKEGRIIIPISVFSLFLSQECEPNVMDGMGWGKFSGV